jgi:hypothetical protein
MMVVSSCFILYKNPWFSGGCKPKQRDVRDVVGRAVPALEADTYIYIHIYIYTYMYIYIHI